MTCVVNWCEGSLHVWFILRWPRAFDLCRELVWREFECVIHPEVTPCIWGDVKMQELFHYLHLWAPLLLTYAPLSLISSGLVVMSPSLFVKDRRIVLFFFFHLCGHLSSDSLSIFSIMSRDPVNHTFVSAWVDEYGLAVLLFTRELHVYISATAQIFHLFMNNKPKKVF